MNPVIDSSLVLYYDNKNQKCWLPNNIIRDSTNFTTSNWNRGNFPVNVNLTSNINAFGTVGSYLVNDSTTNSNHYFYNNTATYISGLIYTATIYVRKAIHSWFFFGFTSQFNNTGAITLFNFDTGQFGIMDNSILSYDANQTINGWWKLRITAKALNTASSPMIVIGSSNNNGTVTVPIYPGTSTNFVEVCGIQVVQSDVDKPFEITTGAIINPTTVVNLMKLNNGTLTNGIVADGHRGTFNFDGVNDYVTLGSFTSIGITDRTISVWFKSSTLGVGRILALPADDTVTDKPAVTITVNGSLLYVDAGGTPYGGNVTMPISQDTWYNVSVTVTASKVLIMYVNGLRIGDKTYTTSLISTNCIGYLGRYNAFYGQYFKGLISLPMIYTRVLTQAEVLQNYNAQKTRFIQ